MCLPKTVAGTARRRRGLGLADGALIYLSPARQRVIGSLQPVFTGPSQLCGERVSSIVLPCEATV